MSIMDQMILPDSIVYINSLHSYDALDVSKFHHVRINPLRRFVDRQYHSNGIVNFWKYAERHLCRFKAFHLRAIRCS